MGLVIIFAAVMISVGLWWLRILVTLLREGPPAAPEGWLASIIVVTFLGPLGAFLYKMTRPDLHVGDVRRGGAKT